MLGMHYWVLGLAGFTIIMTIEDLGREIQEHTRLNFPETLF